MRPGAQPAGNKPANPNDLPQIPQFRKAGGQGAAAGAPGQVHATNVKNKLLESAGVPKPATNQADGQQTNPSPQVNPQQVMPQQQQPMPQGVPMNGMQMPPMQMAPMPMGPMQGQPMMGMQQPMDPAMFQQQQQQYMMQMQQQQQQQYQMQAQYNAQYGLPPPQFGQPMQFYPQQQPMPGMPPMPMGMPPLNLQMPMMQQQQAYQPQNNLAPQNQHQEDFNSDREEQFFNIGEDSLSECINLHSARGQIVKTFKPGSEYEARTGRGLPETPGFERNQMYKKNKPSKGRVKMNPKTFKNENGELILQSDIGGDGGDQYLFDMEELKKAMADATGATGQKYAAAISAGNK